MSSEQVWCTVSTGAPESSNCPPGSSEIAPPPVTSNKPMMLSASTIGSQPSRCCMPSSSARMLRRPSYGTGLWPSSVNTNFSCSVPSRKRDLGLLPASNHATRSSRVSIGVMSTWSRAMQGSDEKGRDLTRRLQGRAIGSRLGCKQRRETFGLSAALRVGLPRPARKTKAALVPVVNEIDIRIMRTLPLGARADLEIERIALRLVDEMMTVRHAGLEACCVARAQHGRATVLDQHDFALEHVNELIFGLVPVAQR